MPRGGRCALAVAVVVLLAISGLFVIGAGGRSAPPGSSARTAVHSAPGVPAATEELAAARASLDLGEGPADWLSASCGGLTPRPSPDLGGCLLREIGAVRSHSGSGGWSELGFPSLFFGGAVAYDALDGYVLEFGGIGSGNATWKYLHGAWSNITTTVGPAPSERLYPSMAYDPALGSAVLFGGEQYGYLFGTSTRLMSDTWEFHSGHWSNVTSSVGPAPASRSQAGLAYDANDSALVLFGGINATSAPRTGTWEFQNSSWRNVSANQTVSPTPSSTPSLAGDISDGYALLYGSGTPTAPYQNQTWTFSANHWTNATAHVSAGGGAMLPNLENPMLTTDSSPGGVLLYGGLFAASTGLSFPHSSRSLWHYGAGVWTLESNQGPPGSIEALFSDDPPDHGAVLNGGIDDVNESVSADTWNISGGVFYHVAFPSSPPPAFGSSMTYDSTTASVVLWSGGDLNVTWTYSGGSWTLQHPASAPPPRLAATLIDDPSDHGVLLFGGESLVAGATKVQIWNDTWLWSGGSWSNLTATAHGPTARAFASGALDSNNDAPTLFGGESQTALLNDTWQFATGRWTSLPASAGAPSPRIDASLSDDPADHGLMAFGGYGCYRLPGGDCPDTWTLSNGSWTQRHVATPAPPQYDAGLAYDPTLGGEVLVGGVGWVTISVGNASYGHLQQMNSTWLYSGGNWTNLTPLLGLRAPPPGSGSDVAYDAADGALFLLDGGAGNLGYNDWWTLTSFGTSPLAVGTPTATVNPVLVNTSTTFHVTVSGGTPPYEVTWSGLPPGCSSSNVTALACTPNAATVTVVTVTATDALGGRITSAGLTLTVNSSGTGGATLGGLTASPATSTLAPSESVVLTATAEDTSGHTIVGATYAWSIVSGSFGAYNQSSGGTVRFTAGSVAGTADLKVVASYGGKTATAFANVTVAVSSVPPNQGTTTSSSSFPYVEVGIAAAVVVIVAIAVVALMMRRRGAPPAPPAAP